MSSAHPAGVEVPPETLSVSQIGAFTTFALIFILWGYAQVLSSLVRVGKDVVIEDRKAAEGNATLPVTSGKNGEKSQILSGVAQKPLMKHLLSAPLFKVLTCDTEAILANKEVLDASAEFAAWMLWIFLADRTSVLGTGTKDYSRDLFLAVLATMILIAFGSGVRAEKRVMTLSRQQTEEWKGWMQVTFLLYHYFEATEAYNAIRVFIAGYVWMTGYGNFHYYYRTKDFCIGRFAQMMWRLNFLVVVVCIVMRNDYMLYYICPMHTLFTVLVYVPLAIYPAANDSRAGMGLKLVVCTVLVALVWEFKAVFYTLWAPIAPLVGYIDPRKQGTDAMHEWYFRSGLDRYVWIYGMLLAWIHPHIEAMWDSIEQMPPSQRSICRGSILAIVTSALYMWYVSVYTLDKFDYNALHPFTSWIPITCWIFLRNLTPWLRSHSLGFLGWLGCITLETYIGQFHIWLKSVIPNGQPKLLLELVPGYPLCNFLLCSVMYVYAAYRLFNLTNALKNAFVPHNDNATLLRNTILMAISSVIMFFVGIVLHAFMYFGHEAAAENPLHSNIANWQGSV